MIDRMKKGVWRTAAARSIARGRNRLGRASRPKEVVHGRDGDVSSLDPKGRAAMALARAISPSPAALHDTVLETTRTLEPAAIIELVVRLSVLQAYYRA